MNNPLVLALSEFTKEFTVVTDASRHGIGVSLGRKTSSLLQQSFILKAPGHVSLLERDDGHCCSCTKVEPYLVGRLLVIKTDHQSLKYLLKEKISTPLQQKWMAKLMGYDYDLHNEKAIDNVVANTLSRGPHEGAQFHAILIIKSQLLTNIHQSCQQDPQLQSLIQKLQDPTFINKTHYTLKDQQLRRKR
ncbi:hypothetical protein ACH5RR_009287 [Cinchona calisaya]|uniref:Reverse transcriptase RNase H-like domain-containing protein n=1 Tax=Cinchona calisaya TaxID=153742 RepID=A0ABD3AHC9_9GENT